MSAHPLHERFREELRTARAGSCQVLATFLDIRGFSSFSAVGESFDTALYLRSIFDKILSDIFADAAYFKSTGDGLMLIHELHHTAAQLPEMVSSVLLRATGLVDAFGAMVANDPTINFEVPQHLGVGIARGSVTKLVSDSGVLDYTGRCLNLAARLMDKARPYGVVFNDRRASDLMTEQVATLFTLDSVCLRGIAETSPLVILISRGVNISQADREPIPQGTRTWGASTDVEIPEIRRSAVYTFWLPRYPHSYERVGVEVNYPDFDETGKRRDSSYTLELYGKPEESSEGAVVAVDLAPVKAAIRGLPATTKSFWSLSGTSAVKVKFTSFIEPSGDA
ncbi:MAG: nucleotidyl cyclase domain-containing protein [Candidatus Dormibacteria bacterium]